MDRRGTVLLAGPFDGGIGPYVASEASGLTARGWHVARPAIPEDGVPVADALRGVRRAWRLLREADVVHVELGRLNLRLFWFGLFAALVRGNLVLVCHDPPDPVLAPASGLLRTGTRLRDAVGYRLLSPLLDRFLLRLLYRRSALGVTLSAGAAASWAGPRTRLAVQHGADPPAGGPSPSRGKEVLFAGYIDPRKGLDLLLDAWERIGSRTDMSLLIVGEATTGNPEVAHYVERQRERSRVMANPPVWFGHVSPAQLSSLFSGAAVVVLPYRVSNPASGILVRAMVEGRPVVATPVPAARDAIRDGVDGLLVAPEDAPALASALGRLLAEPGLRDRLGQSAAERAASRFTWDRQVDGLERAYALAHR